MGANLPEDTWVNIFGSSQPRSIVAALQHRLHASETHVHALAELYRERAVIEQEYAAKLAKLARSAESGQLNGKGGVDWDRGSGEAKLFNTAVSELTETSTAHASLAQLIKSDFEAPVRDLRSKVVPWRRIGDQDAQLDRLMKDLDKATIKLDKASSKRSTKTDNLQIEVSQLSSQISSLTPSLYATFQRLDEERLRILKEILVNWTTVHAEMVAKGGERSAASLATLLGWEPADEVMTVAYKLSSGSATRSSISHPPSTLSPSTVGGTPSRRASMQPPAIGGGAPTDFGPRVPKSNGSSNHLPSLGGGGGFGGLKSMLTRKGTMAGRQRSGSEATSTRSAKRPGTIDTFEPLGEGHEGGHGHDQASSRQHSDSGRPRNPSFSHESFRANSSSAPPVDSEGYSIAPADRHRNPWDDPNDRIGTPTSERGAAGVALPSTILADQQQRSSSPSVSHDQSSTTGSIAGSDGVSNRFNLALSPAVIQESEEERNAALTKMQHTLQMAPQGPARRKTTARGRRDGRHSMQPPLENGMRAHLAKLGEDGEEPYSVPESPASSQPTPTGTTLAPPEVGRRPSAASIGSSPNPFESNEPVQSVAIPVPQMSPAAPMPPTQPSLAPIQPEGPPVQPVPSNQSLVQSPPTSPGPSSPTAETVGAAAFGAVAGAAVGGAAAVAGESMFSGNRTFTTEPESLESPSLATGSAAVSPFEGGSPATSPMSMPTTTAAPTSPTATFSPSSNFPAPEASSSAAAAPAPPATSTGVSEPGAVGIGGAEFATPGLRATIVETVHCLSRQMVPQRTVIAGEIRLTMAGSPSLALPPPGSAIHVRLVEFEALENVAPNPAFLAQVPNKPGEFYLNADQLAQATAAAAASDGSGLGPVLFKYHVLIPAGAEASAAPLLLGPAFQVKNGETRMIFHYRTAPGMDIRDLNLAAHFPADPAVSALQSKPVNGSWVTPTGPTSADDRCVIWSPPVQAQGADGKIIARFMTSPGASPLSPTSVNAQFVIPNHLFSGINVQVVDGEDPVAVSGWSFDSVTRSTVSGKYVGEIALNP